MLDFGKTATVLGWSDGTKRKNPQATPTLSSVRGILCVTEAFTIISSGILSIETPFAKTAE